MAHRLVFHGAFFLCFESSLSLRPDSTQTAALVAEGKGKLSGDAVLAVTGRGTLHQDHGNSHGSAARPHVGHPPRPFAAGLLSSAEGNSSSAPLHTPQGGLIELQQSHQHIKPTAPATDLKPNDVVIFYGILYTAALATFMCFRYLQSVKVNCSWLMRQVAVTYWRWSRLAPICASCVLFMLADLLAQAAGTTEDHGHMCWKTSLLVSSALFNAVWHHVFYTWLDGKAEEGEGFRGQAKQMAIMQGLHLLVYLPIAVPFYIILTDFFNRTLHDAVTNCSISALAAIPRNLGESTTLAAGQLASSYSWSLVFWPASNLINFAVVQMWSPGFKSTWDGIVVVLWNAYILALHSVRATSDPMAVGPMLANRDALTAELKKQAATVDCSKSSFYAIGSLIVDGTWLVTKYTVENAYFFSRWFCVTSKTGTYNLGCYIRSHIWNAWCVNCYIWRKLYMLLWTVMSYVCTITWRLLMIPFKMFDAIKWYVGLFFVPKLWDYDNCPCMKANFDSSWTNPGVIYDGTLFGTK